MYTRTYATIWTIFKTYCIFDNVFVLLIKDDKYLYPCLNLNYISYSKNLKPYGIYFLLNRNSCDCIAWFSNLQIRLYYLANVYIQNT